MRLAKVFVLALVVAVCAAMVSRAQEASVSAPAASIKLVKPWSGMASLNDEQKTQIDQIHKEALAQIRSIRQKERQQIMELLSDEQKQEATRLTRRIRSTPAVQGEAGGEKM